MDKFSQKISDNWAFVYPCKNTAKLSSFKSLNKFKMLIYANNLTNSRFYDYIAKSHLKKVKELRNE